MKKQSINFNLDPDLVAWIRQEAKRRRCSLSQVIRDLLVKEMAQSR